MTQCRSEVRARGDRALHGAKCGSMLRLDGYLAKKATVLRFGPSQFFLSLRLGAKPQLGSNRRRRTAKGEPKNVQRGKTETTENDGGRPVARKKVRAERYCSTRILLCRQQLSSCPNSGLLWPFSVHSQPASR